MVKDRGPSRVSPGLVQARDDVTRKGGYDSMHRRDIINLFASLFIGRESVPRTTSPQEMVTDLSTAYPMIDYLRSPYHMRKIQNAHLHPSRQFVMS